MRGEQKTNDQKSKVGIGCRVGNLTVVSATEKRRQGYIMWRCRCDCGGEILLDTRYLQRGTVRDCGCGSGKIKTTQKDLTGRRFGRLVCLEPTPERGSGGGVVWRCRCDCGNDCLAVSTQLISGYKKSCGCLGHPPRKDWIGKRFGMLEVISYLGKWDGSHYWRCRCTCGNQIDVRQTNLQNGHTKSCGCLQKKIHKENLRLIDGTSVTALENRMKGGTICTNTSGYNGVYRNKRNGKWTAQITFKSKTYYLGSYSDIKDAVKARRRGEVLYERFLEWYYREHEKEKM